MGQAVQALTGDVAGGSAPRHIFRQRAVLPADVKQHGHACGRCCLRHRQVDVLWNLALRVNDRQENHVERLGGRIGQPN